jgi:hypothetical protein
MLYGLSLFALLPSVLVYLTTLYQLQRLYSIDEEYRSIIYNKLVTICEEVVIVYFQS